jgi:hypothetical protein
VPPEVLNRLPPPRPVAHELSQVPTDEEITKQLKKMRDSAGGGDEVRLCMIMGAGPVMHERLCTLIKRLWSMPLEAWEDATKEGVVLLLFKNKGSRGDLDNYRGICLLSLISRIIARIFASRLSTYVEEKDILLMETWGFRPYHATTDEIFLVRRVRGCSRPFLSGTT